MNHDKFIQPKEIQINGRLFCISKIPAIEAQGIYSEVCKSVSEHGYIGITMLPMPVVKQILNYAAHCGSDGIWISLGNDPAINGIFENDFGELQELVVSMVMENFGFFVSGRLLDKLAEVRKETDSD